MLKLLQINLACQVAEPNMGIDVSRGKDSVILETIFVSGENIETLKQNFVPDLFGQHCMLSTSVCLQAGISPPSSDSPLTSSS